MRRSTYIYIPLTPSKLHLLFQVVSIQYNYVLFEYYYCCYCNNHEIRVIKSKIGQSWVSLSQTVTTPWCLLYASFPPWDTVARQLNDWEFSHTRGFNLGKGQVELERWEGKKQKKNVEPATTCLRSRPFQKKKKEKWNEKPLEWITSGG